MKKRRPILAFLLSFFCRGLGQLYNGQSKRAIVFFSIEVVLLAILCMLFISTFGSFRGLLTTFAVATPIGIAYAIFVAVDAFKGAHKIRELKLRRYNRWYIYAALLLAVYYVIDPVFVLHKSFRPYRIPSASMEPALLAGDCLTSDVRFYRRHKPQRGDIVIFIYPGDRTKDFIKRVIAVEEETVEVRDKRVYINGREADDPWGCHVEPTTLGKALSPRDNMAPVRIPKDSIFVLGDNRDRSLDSRFWGPIRVSDVKGKPLYIYWAKDKDRIGMIIK
jgi:signal peptidase I